MEEINWMKSDRVMNLKNSLKGSFRTAIACVMVAVVGPAFAAPQQPTYIRDAQPNFKTDEIPVIRKDTPLFSYSTEGAVEQIKMTGVYNERSFRFFSPKNQVISKASVSLRYTPSPALIPAQSQLNVYMNGQLQKSLPITKEQLGNQVSETVDLNPKQIEDTNRITLEFVGQYTPVCGSIASPSLWLTIDSSSYLTLNTQNVRLANDLSLIPTPFVNTLSPQATTLPVVFAEAPDNKMKQAAAVIASWAGVKAEWRGVEFPVYYNEQPAEQNFVAFVTNDRRPDFLRFLPQVNAPTISVVDAPNSLFAKVLVIAGRDEEDILTASRYLATADKGIAGGLVTIENFSAQPPRKAYDAPAWINPNEKVRFDQITKYRGQLTSTGYHPAPITLEVKLPPDLFMVTSSNVNLDLKYRYTKPLNKEPAQMRFLLNDQLVESFELSPNANSNSLTSQFSMLNGLANLWNNTSIPSRLLAPENIMKFDFQYALSVAGGSPDNCKSVALIPNQVEVDPNSTIDFRDFYHFARLPDLKLFTVSGFPFSKYADLSQTLVLIREKAPANVVSTMLNTMGRIGAQVGYPAVRVNVASSAESGNAKEKDILVFAETSADIKGLEKLEPDIILEKMRTLVSDSFNKKAAGSDNIVLEDTGVGAIAQYESPFSSGRSVVTLLGDGQDGSALLNRRLMYPGDLKLIGGSVAIFRPNAEPASYEAGPDYYTGSLPWHQRVWYSLLDQPLLLVLFTLICALVFAGGIYYLMHSVIRFRNRRH